MVLRYLARAWALSVMALALSGCGDDAASDAADAADADGASGEGGGAPMDDATPDATPDAGGGDALGEGLSTVQVDPEGCDFGGFWAVHRVSFGSVDSPLVSGPQKSTRWYYLEAVQEGDEVTIERGLWCGDWTTGDATVRYADATYEALQPLASTDGRRGSYTRVDSGCELALERIYWVYGLEPREDFLEGVVAPPGRIEGDPELDTLAALPRETDASVVDVDGDGSPGAQSLIIDTPVGSGVRHAIQRGWEQIAGPTPRGASDFRVPAQYDFEEVALEAMPEAFKSNAFVRQGAPHEVRFVRVDAAFGGADDLETCTRVRELLPHRPEPRDAF